MGLNNGTMLKSVKVGILMGGVLALSACSFFKSAECGTSDTKELVASIISDKVKEKLAYGSYLGLSKDDIAAATAQVALEINTIRTLGGGKDAGGFVCEGSLTANLNQDQIDTASLRVTDGDPKRSLIGYNNFSKQGFDGKKLTTSISYRVQKTDDGDSLYAEITDVDNDFLNAYANLVLQAVKNARPTAPEQAPPASAPVYQEPAQEMTESSDASAAIETEEAPVIATPAEIRPSFNCAKASTNAEKLVCSDAELASLDVSLSAAYKQHLSNSSDRTASKKAQVAWIKGLNAACSDVECMKNEYQKRISVLSAAAQ